jgi:hypothetical protein
VTEHGFVDMSALLRRIAGEARTESTLQSEIHAFLLAADLNLQEDDIRAVTLESPTGGRRIDIEVGHVCIEVKKELRQGRSLERAVVQLSAYVSERADSLGRRYTGILTDGTEWRLYHLALSVRLPSNSGHGLSHLLGARQG